MKVLGKLSHSKFLSSFVGDILLKPYIPAVAVFRFRDDGDRTLGKYFMPFKRDKTVSLHVATASNEKPSCISSELRFGDVFRKPRENKIGIVEARPIENFAKFFVLSQNYNLKFDDKVNVDEFLQNDASVKAINTFTTTSLHGDAAVTPLDETVTHRVESDGVNVTGYGRGGRLSKDSLSLLVLPVARSTYKILCDSLLSKDIIKGRSITMVNVKNGIPTNFGTSLPLNLFKKMPLLHASCLNPNTTRRLSFSSKRRRSNKFFKKFKLNFGKGKDFWPFKNTARNVLSWLRENPHEVAKHVFVISVCCVSNWLVSDESLKIFIRIVEVPAASAAYDGILKWLRRRFGKTKVFKSKEETESIVEVPAASAAYDGILKCLRRRSGKIKVFKSKEETERIVEVTAASAAYDAILKRLRTRPGKTKVFKSKEETEKFLLQLPLARGTKAVQYELRRSREYGGHVRYSDVETTMTSENNLAVEQIIQALREKEMLRAPSDKIATAASSKSLLDTKENLKSTVTANDIVSHTFTGQDFTEKGVSKLLESLDKDGILVLVITK